MKAGLVDVATGSLVSDREKLSTPQPANPTLMRAAFEDLVSRFGYEGPVGVGFPAVVRDSIVHTANNIDASWIGQSAIDVFGPVSPGELTVLNDADAAAVAEERVGAARGVPGLVAVITFGTGIGSGLLFNGKLIENSELGSTELDGYVPAELFFSAKARKNEGLSWQEWGQRANRFLSYVVAILSPKLIVVGGGVAKHWDDFSAELKVTPPVVPAAILNNAGIVGAAVSAR